MEGDRLGRGSIQRLLIDQDYIQIPMLHAEGGSYM